MLEHELQPNVTRSLVTHLTACSANQSGLFLVIEMPLLVFCVVFFLVSFLLMP